MKKIGRKAIIILLILIGIWIQMVIVDYTLCKKAQAPLYAVRIEIR
ncbi:MAG: hypothetical protein J6F30_10460 [Cellulosilyticum sp.]|nr:hypothetical protein [Cellulosilyticum sp.]